MRCSPRGFYTVGKGKDRVVHPVCGRGQDMGQIAYRVKKAQAYARRHGLKTGPVIMVPKLETYKQARVRPVSPTPRTRKTKISKSIERREKREAKKIKGEYGANLRVTLPLSKRFPGRLPLILEQANAAYHYRNPGIEQNPEPYELSEGGYLDEALESLGLPHVPTYGS